MPEKEVLFSIIVPTYNRADKLAECLDSLNRQTFQSFEVLVCDDGSTDHTALVVEKYKGLGLDIRHLWDTNFGGPSRPRNTGIKEARGPWLCFLDSDDRWKPEKLEKCNLYLEEADFICHDFDIDFGNGKYKTAKTPILGPDVFVQLMVDGNPIFTSGVCVKKSIIVALGGFSEDEDLIAVEDFDLWLRVARLGCRFKVIQESLGVYWMGGGNISVGGEKQVRRILAVYNRHLNYLEDNKIAARRSEAIMNYQIGFVKKGMGKSDEATRYFRLALIGGGPRIRIKSFIWFMLASLRLIK